MGSQVARPKDGTYLTETIWVELLMSSRFKTMTTMVSLAETLYLAS